MPPDPHARTYLPGLDLLRVTAALMVVLFHLGFRAAALPDGLLAEGTPWRPAGWQITWVGWIGVQVFFLLSGTVIGLAAMNARHTPMAFLTARLRRLVPALLIAACIVLIVEITLLDRAPSEALLLWARTVILAPTGPWLMGQVWTLGVELSFYALVAGCLALGHGRHLPRLGIALIALCSLYWALRTGLGGTDPMGRLTQLALLQHGAFFGLGLILATAPRWRGAATLAALPAMALQIRATAVWESGPLVDAALWPVPFAILMASVALVHVSLQAPPSPGRTGRVLKQAGRATYPLYLVHNHLGWPVLLWTQAQGLPLWVGTLGGTALSCLVAWWIATGPEPALRRALGACFATKQTRFSA